MPKKFQRRPADPYPANYDETVARFRREREAQARPELASVVEDMEQYAVVFLGYPNWGGDMPHGVMTFLEQYDFSGKKLIPFCTHGGGGWGQSLHTLRELCSTAEILEGFERPGQSRSETELEAWLERLDLK